MKKYLFILFTTLIVAQQKPKLVVGIVIDQMKMDYLYRYNDDFSENGFKKIMKNGFVFHNMHFNYMPTVTGPGHASVYTGTTPSIHGIVGNEWYSKKLGKETYCVLDESVKTLGDGTESEGQMSPKNLLSSTITDELKLASNFKSKVIGISLKDRGAVLPAGHFADGAYWFSDSGAFISSTFYFKQLPSWVQNFNDQKKFLNYFNGGWNLLRDKSTYNESWNDENAYEGRLYKKPAFMPYNLNEMYSENNARVLRSTPFGNNFLMDFAKEAIVQENLGQDEITDFLTLSFSSPDVIGHNFGIRSVEMQDTYIRLDLLLAEFLNYLDEKVGKGNYLLFITADHAGAETPKFLKDNNYDVEAINYKNTKALVKEFLLKEYNEDFLTELSEQNVHLNKKLIQSKGLVLENVTNKVKEFLYTLDFIKTVYTEKEIQMGSTEDRILSFVKNGYDYKENGELIYILKPGFMEYSGYGTTHGSLYSYDTHVPGLFYGTNIKKGSSAEKKHITQIAPTLSQLLKISFPNGSENLVLTEVFKKL